MNHDKQCGVTPHVPKVKIYWKEYIEKRNIWKIYWLGKVNIDTINWEKLFDRSTDYK